MKYFFTLLLIGTATLVSGQNDYLINLKGDSIFGKIDIYRDTYYDGINVKTSEGKKVFKAFQIKEAKVDSDLYEPINYRNRKVIGKVLAKGRLSYYAVIPEDQVVFADRILYKEDQSFLLASISFRKRIAEFVSDCDDLFQRIKNKELGYADIDEIVRIYNNDCMETKVIANDVPDNTELISFAQLLLDITSKIDKDEEVPNYMIDALSKYSEMSLDDQVEELLKSLKKN